MALDDYMESEVGVAVGATAALLSPRVRHWVRQGVVYSVAGGLTAGNAVVSGVRGVGRVGRNASRQAISAPRAA
jgi:nucleoside phosphorylase